MRSKSILYGAANLPIEPTSNVDSRTTNNIVIKNYPSGTVSDAPTEIKKRNNYELRSTNVSSSFKSINFQPDLIEICGDFI
ncbi:hypothetical protein TVAG_598190, partial [Trichomonas vaginalis G3]